MPYIRKNKFYAHTKEGLINQRRGLGHKQVIKGVDFLPVKLKVKEYANDIICFLEEQFFIPESQRPIVLEPFQKEKILKPLFYGERPYTMALIGEPKKSGKSCLGAGIAEWYLFTQGVRPGENVEILLCASDKEQASWVVFDKLKKAIQMNKQLARQCKISSDKIEIAKKSSVVRVLATDVSGAGQNADLVLFDELYLYKYPNMREFFEVMTTVPTKPHPLILILTTAGFEEDEEDLLYSLYLKGMNLKTKPDPTFHFWWDTGYKANRMPWQTRKYLTQQKGRLREQTFRRFHLNEWTTGEASFISQLDIENCLDEELVPALPDKDLRIIVGVDVGLKHDATAVVSVTKEMNQIKLVAVKKFQGRPGKEVDLEMQVESYIQKLADDFTILEVLYDPYQFARSAQTLKRSGIKMTEFPQTLDRLTAMSQNLYDLVKGRNLLLFKNLDLIKHLLNAKAKETARGWRIIKKETAKKIDLVIGLAMACQSAVIQKITIQPGRVYDRKRGWSSPQLATERGGGKIFYGGKLQSGGVKSETEKLKLKILSKRTEKKKKRQLYFRGMEI